MSDSKIEASEGEVVRLEHAGPEGRIAILTVDREKKLNALNAAVIGGLAGALAELASRASEGLTRCVILTGAGDKAFVAGADIAEMKDMGAEEARAFAARGHAVMDALEGLSVPTIACVQGFALGGGCELALACDLLYASERARFGQPEVKLGVVPGFGGTQRLMRRVGPGIARELIFTGRMIKADEAHRIGLADRVFAPEALREEAMKAAAEICEMGPLAVAEAKRVMRAGEDRGLTEGLALEVEAFARCFATADQKEGMDAFLAKRGAEFKGK